LQQQPFDPRLQDGGAALMQHWQAASAEVTGLTEQNAQLTVRSAFAGRIVTINSALQPGTQLPLGESLLQVVSPNGVRLDAYVTEEDLLQIRPGAYARFIADEPGVPRVACRVDTIDRINLATLDPPQLASVYGGPIAARLDRNNQAVPLQTIFRVRMDRCTGLNSTSREISGSVLIGRERRSLLTLWWRRMVAVLRREGTL
jgi:putative peptide zinc metalloprotease protein